MSAAPGILADSSAAGLTAQLSEVWASLADLGAGLDDDDWGRATACPGWPVSAQYAHILGTESSLLGRPNPEVDAGAPEHVRNPIGGFNEIWVAALAPSSRSDLLGQFAEVTAARREALKAMGEEEFSAPSWTPVGNADYRRFMQIRVFDCWVHEQDVRDSVGRPGNDSGPVADQSLDEIVRALGFLVGKKAGAPDGASVRFELTGPAGRRVDVAVVEGRARVVDAVDGDPTATVTLSAAAFARLACGRVAPTEVVGGALGGLALAGDAELGRRVVDNLAFTI